MAWLWLHTVNGLCEDNMNVGSTHESWQMHCSKHLHSIQRSILQVGPVKVTTSANKNQNVSAANNIWMRNILGYSRMDSICVGWNVYPWITWAQRFIAHHDGTKHMTPTWTQALTHFAARRGIRATCKLSNLTKIAQLTTPHSPHHTHLNSPHLTHLTELTSPTSLNSDHLAHLTSLNSTQLSSPRSTQLSSPHRTHLTALNLTYHTHLTVLS